MFRRKGTNKVKGRRHKQRVKKRTAMMMSNTRRRNKASNAVGAEDEERTAPNLQGEEEADEHTPRDSNRTVARQSCIAVIVACAVFVLFVSLLNPSANTSDTAAVSTASNADMVRRTAVVDDSVKQVKPIMAKGNEDSSGALQPQEGAAAAAAANAQSNDSAPNSNTNKDAAVDVLNQQLSPDVKISKMSDTLETCQSTIVTGYFKIRSKFAATEYLAWMKNFLSVQDCLVIFSSEEMMGTMKELRAHAPARTVLIQLEIDDLPISRLHAASDPNFWQNQLDIDYEKNRHKSFELFWIWLSKSWCVRQAIDKNFFHSNIFMWQDIGSYRNKGYNGKKIMQRTELIPPKTLLWMAHHPPNAPPNPIWNDKRREGQYYFHSGSQSAGDKEAWIEYHQRFAETMDMFLDKNIFIGEDQCVLQGTCQRFPDLCAYVRKGDVKDNHYFGLRYLLVNGGTYNFWRMPGATAAIA